MANAVELGAPTPSPIPTDLQRPCAAAALDADLITAVKDADAATKAAIIKALAQ